MDNNNPYYKSYDIHKSVVPHLQGQREKVLGIIIGGDRKTACSSDRSPSRNTVYVLGNPRLLGLRLCPKRPGRDCDRPAAYMPYWVDTYLAMLLPPRGAD